MIAYLTDLEGRWDKLVGAVEASELLSLGPGGIELAPGASLVFGGDAMDRGPAGRRVLSTLLAARRRYGERVVWLAGNRDINKLRLHRELGGHPHPRAPAEARTDRVSLLRWIFGHTMGAREAFVHRATELAAEGRPNDDEAVVRSFAEDSAPDGLLTAWLRQARLVHRVGRTLFVHGGVTEQSLGHVPSHSRCEDPDRWIHALHAFYDQQMDAFVEQRLVDGVPGWSELVAYQAPLAGTSLNQASVVYGRLADGHNDPRLPQPSVTARLRAAGIDRLVVGHTPVGDLPAVLRRDGFTLVMADTSYGRLEHGAIVELDQHRVRWAGRCRLDDGTERSVRAELTDDDDSTLGAVTAEGRLVKARTPDGWWLFRAKAGRQVEQIVVGDPGPLGAPPFLPPDVAAPPSSITSS